MRTHLENLRNLVVQDFEKLLQTNIDANAAPVTMQWMERLRTIEDGLFTALRFEVLGVTNDRLVERHIRQVQFDCIYLMDSMQLGEHIPLAVLPIQKAINKSLSSILNKIEHHHQQYFDLKARVPKSYFNQCVKELKSKCPLMLAGMKKKNIEAELQRILDTALKDFLNLPAANYEQLIYVKFLVQSVINICNDVNNTDFTELLTEHLLYARFNSTSFTRYCKTKIANTLSTKHELEEQFNQLWAYKKAYKAQEERASTCFDPYVQSTKLALIEYLKAELQFLARKFPKEALRLPAINFSDRLRVSYRIKLTVTADVLAYLVRLLIETNVITANPRTELIAFLAHSCQTPGIGSNYLSANSLNTKYKQVVQTTAKTVRNLLMKMLKKLDDDFQIT